MSRMVMMCMMILLSGIQFISAQESTLSELLERGEYVKIKSLANERLFADSSDLEAITTLAKVYEQEQNIAKAIKYNHLRWKQDSTNYLIARKLGQLYEDAEIYREATYFYRLAYDRNPLDFHTNKGLIQVLIAQESLIEADSLVNLALLTDSLNVAFLLADARIGYKLRDMPRTSGALVKAGHLTNLSNYFQRMLGYAFLQQDSVEQAIIYLTAALENDKNPEITYYYMALAYERKDDKEKALGYYNRAIEEGISKELGNYYFRRGQIYFLDKKYKLATAELETALNYEVNEAVCHYFLAVCYDNRYKDKTKAINHFDLAAKSQDFLNPDMRAYAKSRSIQLKEARHLRQ